METPLEHVLMNSYKEEMIAFVADNPQYFDELVLLAMKEKQPYAWRAAWLLWSCIEENDPRLHSYIPQFMDSLPEKKDGHIRELVKILTSMELDEEQEGRLFDYCVTVWEKLGHRPSIRYMAFRFLVKMAKKHPELGNEIGLFAQEHYTESLSPGIKHSINKMIKELAAFNS